jgi:hypothetical protein
MVITLELRALHLFTGNVIGDRNVACRCCQSRLTVDGVEMESCCYVAFGVGGVLCGVVGLFGRCVCRLSGFSASWYLRLVLQPMADGPAADIRRQGWHFGWLIFFRRHLTSNWIQFACIVILIMTNYLRSEWRFVGVVSSAETLFYIHSSLSHLIPEQTFPLSVGTPC